MEDRQIVQLYWDRDEKAISATAEKYEPFCMSIAKNILGNREDAEECVNDTYLRAWKAMPPHRPNRLSAFLGKITRNLSFNKYCYYTAEKRGGGEMPVVLEELGECVSGGDDVEQKIDRMELIHALNDFLRGLSDKKRNIFLCRYWYADSVRSLARRFGMREGTVSMTLNRLRRELKGFLTERGFEV